MAGYMGWLDMIRSWIIQPLILRRAIRRISYFPPPGPWSFKKERMSDGWLDILVCLDNVFMRYRTLTINPAYQTYILYPTLVLEKKETVWWIAGYFGLTVSRSMIDGSQPKGKNKPKATPSFDDKVFHSSKAAHFFLYVYFPYLCLKHTYLLLQGTIF